MTGLVRKATLLSVCGLFIAGSAMAFVPAPSTTIVPCGVVLGATNTGSSTVEPAVQFTITVKDIASNPIPNSAIEIDFSACCNDIRLAATQPTAGVGIVGKKITATTNGSGIATIRIAGGATKNAVTAGNVGCATIKADGVLITDGTNHPLLNVATFDLDAAAPSPGPGVGPADISVFVVDSFSAYRQRSDYDHNALCSSFVVGPADLSKLVAAAFSPNSVSNVGTYVTCP